MYNLILLKFYSVRKNVNDLKNSLENVVIPMFCSADLSKYIHKKSSSGLEVKVQT